VADFSSSRSMTPPFCIRRRCSRADANAAAARYVATKSAGPARVAIDKKIAQDRPRALRLIGSGKAPVVTVSARRDSPATQSFPATKINTRVNRAGDATGLF
jgi:hypothetical protein